MAVSTIKKLTLKGDTIKCEKDYEGWTRPAYGDVPIRVTFYVNNKETSHAQVAERYGIKNIEKLLGHAYIV